MAARQRVRSQEWAAVIFECCGVSATANREQERLAAVSECPGGTEAAECQHKYILGVNYITRVLKFDREAQSAGCQILLLSIHLSTCAVIKMWITEGNI